MGSKSSADNYLIILMLNTNSKFMKSLGIKYLTIYFSNLMSYRNNNMASCEPLNFFLVLSSRGNFLKFDYQLLPSFFQPGSSLVSPWKPSLSVPEVSRLRKSSLMRKPIAVIGEGLLTRGSLTPILLQ